jgi:hypothetical protein
VDLATRRIEAFGTMELARRDADFNLAAEARERLEGLGIRVLYTRALWPKHQKKRAAVRGRLSDGGAHKGAPASDAVRGSNPCL